MCRCPAVASISSLVDVWSSRPFLLQHGTQHLFLQNLLNDLDRNTPDLGAGLDPSIWSSASCLMTMEPEQQAQRHLTRLRISPKARDGGQHSMAEASFKVSVVLKAK